MKKLVCEACGGTDLVKEGDFFSCQFCGVKYTLADIKSMIVEGTVKIDLSERINNLFVLARRARSNQSYEDAARYYEQILLDAPENWEAVFYTVLCKVANASVEQMPSVIVYLNNNLDIVLGLIAESIADKTERRKAYTEVSDRILVLYEEFFERANFGYANSDFLFNLINMFYQFGEKLIKYISGDPEAIRYYLIAWEKGMDSLGMFVSLADIRSAARLVANNMTELLKIINNEKTNKAEKMKALSAVSCKIHALFDKFRIVLLRMLSKKDDPKCYNALFDLVRMLYVFGDGLSYYFPADAEAKEYKLQAWKKGLEQHTIIQKRIHLGKEEKNDKKKYQSKILAVEPDYKVPKKGCYIATAIYGTYDCPEVWTLRRYRDSVLQASCCGRLFIKIYYLCSPILIKWLGHTDWFVNLSQDRLGRLVSRMKNKGFSDKVYLDK